MNTIENIENDYWGNSPQDATNLIKRIYQLRQRNIEEFETEDLRILIGQDIALEIIMPLALDKLTQNLFEEGDYYEGDLLKAVLTSSKDFWNRHTNLRNQVIGLCNERMSDIDKTDSTQEIRNSILTAFNQFRSQ